MNNVVEIRSTPPSWPDSLEVDPATQAGSFEPFVDEHVIARFLDISARRVLEMARKGQLPAHPLGQVRKTWRFRISEIHAHFGTLQVKQASANIRLAVPGTQERKRLG